MADQLDKFLSHLPRRIEPAHGEAAAPSRSSGGGEADAGQRALGAFLREKSATESQSKKFLATAVWLHAKGRGRLKTGDVTNALRENNQSRLGNASQCLAGNITQGYCERDGDQFFVTDDGVASLNAS